MILSMQLKFHMQIQLISAYYNIHSAFTDMLQLIHDVKHIFIFCFLFFLITLYTENSTH
uniref:Transmembrane protein n=1 Tax=Medicago truncatula TaxID=3880 RepID=I3SRS9_MEDTR|nr:unknown [Medicago truncatula]